MPAPSTLQRGNMLFDSMISAVITPPNALAAASTTTQTYTVNGLQLGDIIGAFNFQAALPNNITVVNMFCSAANVLSVQWTNFSAGNSGASVALNTIIEVCRFENYVEFGYASLPTAII